MSASTMNAQFPATNCGSTGNFTAGSTYQTTLTTLLSSIYTTNSSSLSYGFFNASSTVSGASQTLYLFGLCRGDLTAFSCRACLDALATDMRRLCPLQKEALLYTGNCIIRYSNASFFGAVATEPTYVARTSDNVSSPDAYDAAMMKLLDSLWAEAAGGGSLRKYASGNESAGPDMIYAVVQCTPDLTEQQCTSCLVKGVETIKECCVRYTGGRFMVPSCMIMYETNHRFFDQVSVPLPLPPPPSQEGDVPPPPPVGKSNSTRTVIIGVVTSVSALLVIGVVVLLKVKRKKKQPRQSVEGEVVHEFSKAELQQFDFSTIRAATDNFSDSKKLGQGGFGAVYMGRLSNGQEIAVKRLSQNSHQGEVEFKNEVMLLTRLQHRNLIRLLGFCLKGVERLLIYELMPNPSLDQFIFDPLKRVNLNWDRLHKIVMGVARGLLYLHEDSRLRIIHRDLKASNILLDSDMNPKISDLGLARLLELDQTQAETSRIVGTYGYMAPEYAMHGKFSVKSDVFSFGVLVLEIVSGQRNNLCRMGKDTVALTSYVWKKWREGSISDIIDPSITSGSSTEIARCIHIGLLCVQENFASRPSMASVFLMLNSHSVTLQAPSRPAFFIDSANEFDMSSTQDYSSRVSNVERSRGRSNQFSKNEACMTQDYSSSISNVDRSRGRSNQFSKNEASMTQDYSSRVSDVERSKGKSNQFSENKTSMTEPHGSLRKWETSVPCSLLFMFVVVFLSSMLQKKLSFCA
ncbi:cysteine-rich receptor-like protein kinase 29 isoform X3 [Rhodamnia argentea]|uniref:Cysteine-rich receptor-like protein kinase 29 isoform X3 n=2 Tax=Rhodamnia argentea TaxID=178133 RepID=A0ABM3H8H0_9MYRT|nr:cysteine-rich receptor-like protein kinase 29 isoform X3 [Rhodamnia argentea]